MRTTTTAARTACLAILALGLLAGCLNQGDTKKMDDATAQLFARMQAGQYDAIYADAAPELTGTTSKDGFVTLMQQMDAAYGACQAPVKAMNFNVNANTSGYFATQGYTAQCAKGPKQLQVTMVLRQGVARLAGIHFGPQAATGGSPD